MVVKPFVTKEALEFFKELLEGTSEQDNGLIQLLERVYSSLGLQQRGVDASSASPRLDDSHIDAHQTYAFLKRKILQVERLGNDDRMKEAYNYLSPVFVDDSQWRCFLLAALRADYDFESHRNTKKDATKLAKKIASSADKLSTLLREFRELRIDNMPPEFVSARDLLQIAHDGTPEKSVNETWQKLSPLVLGDTTESLQPGLNLQHPNGPSLVGELLMEDTDRMMDYLRGNLLLLDNPDISVTAAWQAAPKIPTLLSTLALSAAEFEPMQYGMVGEATKSRKSSKHTQYIRAFGHLLTDKLAIPIGTNIQKSIAIVANVILDDPNIDVSSEDVRKALQ